jgi:2-polyprenyl-6-methoxyphenol hydroxylase-like FAD-dependent oxidoreductase
MIFIHLKQMSGVLLSQARHEEIFRNHLAQYDCFVELGTELNSFEQNEDGVVAYLAVTRDGEEVTEEFKCSYLIAADGAHSKIRKQLQLSFLGSTQVGKNLVVGDIVVNKGLENNVGTIIFCDISFIFSFSFGLSGEMRLPRCE